MVTVIADLAASSLAQHVELELFDTAKRTRVGRSLWEAVVSRLRLWRRWWATLGSRDALIAHIHTCSGLSFFFDAVLLALAALRGVPTVLHVHGGAFDKFLDSLSAPLSFIARAAARHAAFVVVLSEEWRTRLGPRLPGATFRVIENGVPVLAESRLEKKLPTEGIILFLGNLTKVKGVWELLDAARELPTGWRVVFVGGDGEPGISARLGARIRELGLAGRVELAGPAVGAEKRSWLERAHIFVLPSHVEGLPVSMLEAMAAALPVVVTPVGAIPSVVRDGEEGLVIPAGDSGRLRDALSYLASDPDLRRRMGEAGRRRVQERYGVEQRVCDYLAMYAEITNAPRGRAFCARKA